MTYLGFFIKYRRILTFSVLLTFFSSFGQTFLLSIFLLDFARAFDLTEGNLGVMYGVATVFSALLLPWTGRQIDRIPLANYTLAVACALALAAALVAVAPHWTVFFIALLALRHLGQGLCGHIAMTTTSRSFVRNRGKAVAIAGTGFPLSEMILPTLATLSLIYFGWRISWGVSAVLIAVVLVPLSYLLIVRSSRVEDVLPRIDKSDSESSPSKWRARNLLLDYRFYLLLSTLIPIGFFSTGFIFYQAVIAENRGWGEHVFAIAFAAFAGTRAITALGAGPWIDRLSAVRLLPVHMILILMSGVLLVFGTGEWAAYLYLIFLGLSMGIGGSVGSAVWAEIYGVENLGGIRSIAGMIGILSTAFAPLIFGLLLDMKVPVHTILAGALVCILTLTIFSFFASSFLSRDRTRRRH